MRMVFEQGFEIDIKTAHDYSIQWLKQHDAKITGGKAPLEINATHGSRMKFSSKNPDMKKEITILLSQRGAGINYRVVTEPARDVAFDKKENIKEQWWNGYFSSLFEGLRQLTEERLNVKTAIPRVENTEKDYTRLIKQLYGMILAEKEIDLTKAQGLLNLSEDRIKVLIYELIGEKKVSGHFKGNTFVIESDISDFVQQLDKSFQDWQKQAGGKT